MVNRWFLVPRIQTTENGTSLYVPKYSGQVDHYTGQEYDIPSSWNLPVTGWHFVVRYYGPTSTLDSIESNTDAYTPNSTDFSLTQVATFLNNVLGKSKTVAEWEQDFWCEV